MAKQLVVRGTDGLVSIHNEGVDYNNPWGNVGNIFFHSSFDYLKLATRIGGTFGMPGRGYGGFNSMFHIATHGLGYSPMLLAWCSGGRQGGRVTGTMIQDVGGDGQFRGLNICADTQNLYLFDYGYSAWGYGGFTLQYDVLIFANVSI